jgi:hypothetical protein
MSNLLRAQVASHDANVARAEAFKQMAELATATPFDADAYLESRAVFIELNCEAFKLTQDLANAWCSK